MKKIKDWWNNYWYSDKVKRRYLTAQDYSTEKRLLGLWWLIDQRRGEARRSALIKFGQAFLLGVALSLTNNIIDRICPI